MAALVPGQASVILWCCFQTRYWQMRILWSPKQKNMTSTVGVPSAARLLVKSMTKRGVLHCCVKTWVARLACLCHKTMSCQQRKSCNHQPSG